MQRTCFALCLGAGLLTLAKAQLGCPMAGCDGRGLFYQADVSLQKKAEKRWSVQTMGVPADLSVGCVGNDNNVVCFAGFPGSNRSLVAVNVTNGIAWSESKLTDPGLPIMNVRGDIIATDGNCMVYVIFNGTYLGTECFGVDMSPASSVLQLKEVAQFYFVSQKSGLLILNGMDGVCVASMYLTYTDGNATYTWIPANQPVLGDDTVYFVAKRNSTDDAFRLYAMAFNSFPPYMSVKWYYDVTNVSAGDISTTRLMYYDGTVLVAFPQKLMGVQDAGSSANVTYTLPYAVTSMALYDADGSDKAKRGAKLTDATGIAWLTAVFPECDYILGIDYKNPSSRTVYTYSMCDILGAKTVRITSHMTVFGYHSDQQVLVVGISAASVKGSQPFSKACATMGGCADDALNYVVALVPTTEAAATVLWMVPTDSNELLVRGQIMGIRSESVVAFAGSDKKGSIMYIN